MIFPTQNKSQVLGAKYTIYVKTLCDINFDFGMETSDYPIFDESYRKTLNEKIIKHYWFNEIGVETPEQFKFYINRALNEIMPYYNELYKTTLYTLDPTLDFSHTEKSDRIIDDTKDGLNNQIRETKETDISNNETNSKISDSNTVNSKIGSNTSSEQNIKNVKSDTPQNLLINADVNSNTYASEVDISKTTNLESNDSTSLTNSNSENIGETNQSGTNKIDNNMQDELKTHLISKNIDDYLRTFKGFNSHPAENIMKIRQTLLNIDMEIINHAEIRACFMGVY